MYVQHHWSLRAILPHMTVHLSQVRMSSTVIMDLGLDYSHLKMTVQTSLLRLS